MIKNVNLEVEKFSKIGILGGSGCGKHILSKLIMKVYKCSTSSDDEPKLDKELELKDPHKGNPLENDKKANRSKIELYGVDLDNINPRSVRTEI